MENTRTSIIQRLVNFFGSFTTQNIEDTEINEEKLSDEDKKLLKELRDNDKVDKIETNMRETLKVKTEKKKTLINKTKDQEIKEREIGEE